MSLIRTQETPDIAVGTQWTQQQLYICVYRDSAEEAALLICGLYTCLSHFSYRLACSLLHRRSTVFFNFCSQVYTVDTSWQYFGNLNYSQVDKTYINSFGSCASAFTPSVASGQFACVISTTNATYNGSLYTLSTQEWTSNSSCPSSPSADVRYYFSGRP